MNFRVLCIIAILVVAAAIGAAALYLTLGDPPVYPIPESKAPGGTIYTTSLGGSFAYTLAALEGIVARSSPQIFLTSGSNDVNYLADAQKQYGFTVVSDNTQQLLSQFIKSVENSNGAVRVVEYDSADSANNYAWEANVAQTIAGINTALPVSSNDIGQFETWFSNVDIIANLVGKFPLTQAGALQAYAWAWNTYGASTTRQFAAIEPYERADTTDYYVEFKAFVFSFCDGTVTTCTYSTDEQSEAQTILSAYSQNTVVLGYFGLGGEVPTVTALSHIGMVQDNTELAPNLSFYSGMKILANVSPQNPQMLSKVYNKQDTYVVWVWTQGDSALYALYNNLNQYNSIDTKTGVPYRDEIPAAFPIDAKMAQTTPPALQQWYSDPKSLASFMSAPSGGAGYAHPSLMPNEQWYVSLSKTVDENAGINDVFIIWSGTVTTSILQTYVADWGSPAPQAIYLWQNNGHAPQIVNGVPVFYASFWLGVGSTFTQQDVTNTVNQIEGVGGNFVYVILNSQNPGYPFISDVMNALPLNYVTVNGEQYACLYLQSQHDSCQSTVTSSQTTQTSSMSISTNTTVQGQSGCSGTYSWLSACSYSWLTTGGGEVSNTTIIAIIVVIAVATAALVYLKRR